MYDIVNHCILICSCCTCGITVKEQRMIYHFLITQYYCSLFMEKHIFIILGLEHGMLLLHHPQHRFENIIY